MANPYNKNLDKITESEVVYDFVERLRLGKDLELPYNGGNKIVFIATTLLLDVLKFILSLLPPSIVFDYAKIKTSVIEMNVGDKTKSIEFDGNRTMIRAYSDKTNMDVSSSFSSKYSSSTNKTTFTITTDIGYPYSDLITVYAKLP